MNNEDLIEGYLKGTLSEEDKFRFNELLISDKEFEADFEFQKNLKVTVILESREALKDKLRLQDKKKKTSPTWLYAAASLLLVIGAAFWFIGYQNNSSDKLYLANFESYPNTVEPLVRGEAKNTMRTTAFTAYEEKDFKKALTLFNKLYLQTEEDYAKFYSAMCYMELNEINKASEILSSKSWTPAYQDKANWYLALCKLALDQKNETRIILQALIKNSDFKTAQAKDLLKKLD